MTMSVNDSLDKNSIFLNIFHHDFDVIRLSVDILTKVRTAFFQTGKKQRDKVFLTAEGEKLSYIYQMDSKGNFKWKVTSDGNLVEQVSTEPSGYIIESKGYTGNIYKKMHFNHGHIWQKSEYFDGYHDEPISTLLPWMNDNRAAIASYSEGSAIPEILFSLRMPKDENKLQKLISIANPTIKAHTNNGVSYFATEAEEEIWNKQLNKMMQTKEASIIEEDTSTDSTDEHIFFDLTALKETSNKHDFAIEEATLVFGAEKENKPKVKPVSAGQKQEPIKNLIEEAEKYADTKTVKEQKEKLKPPVIKKKAKQQNKDCVYADKIVQLTQKEQGLYFGELDADDNRSGYGRTQTGTGKTVYEGDYFSDQKNGFGVGYFKTGRISYIGNWKKDKQNGFGIEIRPTDSSVTLGNFEDNVKIGIHAKFDKMGKLLFAGNWDDDILSGAGLSVNSETGDIFIAKWKEGKQTNFGTLISRSGTLLYNGGYKNNSKEGLGTLYRADGSVLYSGQFKRNVFSGNGTLNTDDGFIISGDFLSGLVNGQAVKRDLEGRKLYEGAWKKNVYHGIGKRFNLDGSYCEGEFSNGEPKGVLNLYNKNDELIYKGTLEKDLRDGKGICYENNEKVYDGQLCQDKRCGTGRAFLNGECIYMGSFEEDLYDGFGIAYANGVQTYCGMWKKGIYNGQGITFEKGKPMIAGTFSNGLPHGRVNIIKDDVLILECIYHYGVCEYMREYSSEGDSLVYEGNIKDGVREGMGCTFTEYAEKVFEGIFKYNEPFKSMKISTRTIENLEYIPKLKDTDYEKYRIAKEFIVEQPMMGGVYSGTLTNGIPDGKGTVLFLDHRYTGNFSLGNPCGKGTLYYGDGTVVSGTFMQENAIDTVKITFSNITYYCCKE